MNAPSSELVLKVSPPRAPRNLLVRPRLRCDDARFHERRSILVQAPAGFGKTSLLAQWRRELLGRGAAVAWLSAQPVDDAARFVQSLALAVRLGCARPDFGRSLIEGATAATSILDPLTTWLAELAQAALEVVLIVDEAERLPAATAYDSLGYLLNNQPPNLRVIVGARGEPDLPVADLLAYGQCVTVGAPDLRFTVDETIALFRSHGGARVDANACAQLHELTEGWPLGLQLALSAIERGVDPRVALDGAAERPGGLGQNFVGSLLAQLAPGDAAFLTRIAAVDALHPDLCAAITQQDDAAERLARLARDTPVFVTGEETDWCRLHVLARDALRSQFAALAPAQRADVHSRAARWLADHDLVDEASRHALAAGERDFGYDLAEQGLYNSVIGGRQASVVERLDRIPPEEIDRRPRLRLAAAWALGLSARHEEAEKQVKRILERSGADAALEYECALIRSGTAAYADQPDRYVALFEPWMEAPESREPLAQRMHANRLAYRALLLGDPAQARRLALESPGERGPDAPYIARWRDFVAGLGYVWEGRVAAAEELLRPSLIRAEADLGRRNQITCMLAAVLAAAVWEGNRPEEATALLAGRIDVLERFGLPEGLLLAYRTAARAAAAERGEERAFELLESLETAGAKRALPRLRIASLTDQVRLHARQSRAETCRELCARIDTLARPPATPAPLWQRSVQVLREVAAGYTAIAAQDWTAARGPLERASAIAEAMRQGRLRLEIMGLRALVLHRSGEGGEALLAETANLAREFGLVRLLADAHPLLAEWAAQGEIAPARVLPAPRETPAAPRALPSTVLTPKEREVLELLARNLSNKEIAQAMQVGEETVKWHLKNLFGKLGAGARKHAVRRAQLLGILEGPG